MEKKRPTPIILRLHEKDLQLLKDAMARKQIFNQQEMLRLALRAFCKAIIEGKI